MEDVLSQLLLSADQTQWGSEALLEQVSPSSDPGYYSACSVSDAGYNSVCQNSDPAYYSACSVSDAGYNSGCQNLDPGYYSACGSVSPASSIDSGCFSPPPLRWGALDFLALPDPVSTATPKPPAHRNPAQAGRKSRSKYPGKKRQSASEREKLRMRDLAKALHHLRTFLPPSVAPTGQTLTKIETLRLAIRYIAHLSAQLEDDRPQASPAQDDLQLSFQPMTAEPLLSFQPGFPQPSDHLSPLLSYQSPVGDFSFTDVSSECFWIPEISHTLCGK